MLLSLGLSACAPRVTHDVVIRNATVYDGSGGNPVQGEVR